MVPFDIDRLYLFLTNSWVAFKKERRFIDSLYQSQRFRFYNKAKSNPLYDSTLMQDRPLETEVTMRRAFGILLCSQDDKELQTGVIEEFIKLYPPIKELCEKFSYEKFVVLEREYRNLCMAKNLSADESNAYICLVGYVIHCKYGFDTDNIDIQRLYKAIADFINSMLMQETGNMRRIVESIQPKKYMIIPRELRKLQDSIQDGKDIIDLLNIFEFTCNPNISVSIDSLSCKHKLELLRPVYDAYPNDCISASVSLRIMCLQFQFQGLSFTTFFDEIEFSKEERDMGLKIVAHELNGVYHNFESIFNIDFYLQALVFGRVAKFIRECKDFYFANNRETQYDELERTLSANATLQEENDQLNRALRNKDDTIRSLQDQIHALSADISKDAEKAQRSLNDAIAILQSQVESLQEELTVEREKNAELNRLREFVFSVQSGADIEETKTPLKDLIADKKIYIFGGQVNWRNKMKATYPSLNLLDGHQKSFDERMLLGADMVLLNTANMSHTVYYKVMDVLRKNKIPFDYIGRFQNIELLEQEIASILQKTLM